MDFLIAMDPAVKCLLLLLVVAILFVTEDSAGGHLDRFCCLLLAARAGTAQRGIPRSR